MPIFLAEESSQEALVHAPESGMGYQILSYRGTTFLALNATYILPFEDFLRDHDMPQLLNELFSGGFESKQRSVERFVLASAFRIVYSQLDRSLVSPDLGLSATEQASPPPPYIARGNRPYSYYRFAAAPRDKRVATNGNFLPNTYATTFADLRLVPSGFAAVGRYAIPNPAPARFVFQIVTFDPPSLMGTATPNYGQAGGGVEVLFRNGATNGPGLSFPIGAG